MLGDVFELQVMLLASTDSDAPQAQPQTDQAVAGQSLIIVSGHFLSELK